VPACEHLNNCPQPTHLLVEPHGRAAAGARVWPLLRLQAIELQGSGARGHMFNQLDLGRSRHCLLYQTEERRNRRRRRQVG
jgi:hypothetical protein